MRFTEFFQINKILLALLLGLLIFNVFVEGAGHGGGYNADPYLHGANRNAGRWWRTWWSSSSSSGQPSNAASSGDSFDFNSMLTRRPGRPGQYNTWTSTWSYSWTIRYTTPMPRVVQAPVESEFEEADY